MYFEVNLSWGFELVRVNQSQLCLHTIQVIQYFYRKTSNKRPRRLFEHEPQNPGV